MNSKPIRQIVEEYNNNLNISRTRQICSNIPHSVNKIHELTEENWNNIMTIERDRRREQMINSRKQYCQEREHKKQAVILNEKSHQAKVLELRNTKRQERAETMERGLMAREERYCKRYVVIS